MKPGILFDYDDTLGDTHKVFVAGEAKVTNYIAERIGIGPTELLLEFQAAKMHSRSVHYVDHRPLWKTTLDILTEKYPSIADHRSQILELIYFEIYHTPILLKPFAKEVLMYLLNEGFTLGLVTNANSDWTHRKLQWAGLQNIFQEGQNLVIIPGHTRKGIEHWKHALELCECKAEDAIGVGDNIKADILPMRRLGAQAILLHEPDNNWAVHAEGRDEMDPQVAEIRSLQELPAVIQLMCERNEWSLPRLK